MEGYRQPSEPHDVFGDDDGYENQWLASVGCGDASCPHRSGVRPYDPFAHREDLEAHVRAARGE